MVTDNKVNEMDNTAKLAELKAKIASAIADGNDDDLMLAVAGMSKFKAEIAKAQAELAKKEAEQLAGKRAELATKIHKAIDKIVAGFKDDLLAVKATGFTFNLDLPDKDGVVVEHKSVALAVPAIKTSKARTGSTGGGSGKSKSEFGMSLDEIYQKFANEEEKANLEAVRADTTLTDKAKNSKMWKIKDDVKKRAIKDGLLVATK